MENEEAMQTLAFIPCFLIVVVITGTVASGGVEAVKYHELYPDGEVG